MASQLPLRMRYIMLVSDATGKTCETVVQAALSQFRTTHIILERKTNVRTVEQIQEVVRQAMAANGIIVYTMVSPELRQQVTELGRRHGVPTVDILGPVLTRLSDLLEISPLSQPGLFRQLDSEYFRRIEAVDFSIKHDDGLGLATLGQAEIVLVGVSRTSKTPVSIYLAYRGWKVANIPVILDEALPAELLASDQHKILALTIQSARLAVIRRERQRKLNSAALSSYADPEQIGRELHFALELYQGQGWTVLDVTSKSVEEVATEVMRSIYSRFGTKKGKISE